MHSKIHPSVFYALLAAALFGLSAPFSKLLLAELSAAQMAALLYLGAGIGMFVLGLFRQIQGERPKEAHMTFRELPFIIGMILLDVAAPFFLMQGLSATSAANAALLGNFEIVATTIVALVFFREQAGKRVWTAIGLITIASILLSAADAGAFTFSLGSLFILLSCVCWGFENNCTRMLSLKDPLQIVIVKGFGSGLGALLLSFVLHEKRGGGIVILFALILGFFSYGLSIFFYVRAQRDLGAVRTSAYYAVAPFVGTGISLAIFREPPTLLFLIAAFIMSAGAYLAAYEKHTHTHLHTKLQHEHRHSHTDGHHFHSHPGPVIGEHSHLHFHEELYHTHSHTPDLHHTHTHS